MGQPNNKKPKRITQEQLKQLLLDYEPDNSIWNENYLTRGDIAKRVFSSLPKPDRILLALHIELGTKQLAELLDISTSLVQQEMKRIRNNFKETFTNYGN